MSTKAPTSQTEQEKSETPEEQDNDTVINTDSQDDKVEKSIPSEPSSTIDNKIDSENKLKQEESKPIEPPIIEPTKTGEKTSR